MTPLLPLMRTLYMEVPKGPELELRLSRWAAQGHWPFNECLPDECVPGKPRLCLQSFWLQELFSFTGFVILY